MSSIVTTRIEDGIAWIDMDDGKVNAMSAPMMTEINKALDAAEEASAGTVAVVVLRGRPGIFSAGFDLKTFARDATEGIAMVRMGAELIVRFLRFPRPILTVCTGHAYPMGAFLMLSADARWGIEGPWRIGMNEVAIGMTLPQFATELARHRLTPAAFSRANTATLFAPEPAREAGYLDVVLPLEDLEASVQAEAERLKALNMANYVATKARINAPALAAIESAIEAEWSQVAGA